MDSINEFVEACERCGKSATKERIAVAQLFIDSEKPVSCKEIAMKLHSSGQRVSLSTVFRTKLILINSGLASNSDFADPVPPRGQRD